MAPKLDPRLRAAILQLAPTDLSPAEATRSVARFASRIGLPPPSYDRVRTLLAEERLRLVPVAKRREEVLADLLAARIPRPP
jgi:hypothetical protein